MTYPKVSAVLREYNSRNLVTITIKKRKVLKILLKLESFIVISLQVPSKVNSFLISLTNPNRPMIFRNPVKFYLFLTVVCRSEIVRKHWPYLIKYIKESSHIYIYNVSIVLFEGGCKPVKQPNNKQ